MVLRRTLHICWWTVAIVLVTLAMVLSAARLLLPEMSDYREQIEDIAAGVLGRSVSIGSLDAAWRGLSPVLKLEKVVISDPRLPNGQLAVDEVDVALDVVDSLLQRKVRTAGVRIIGTRLDLDTDIRHHSGEFPLQAVLAWLLAQDSIALEKVQLRWNDPGLFDAAVRLTDLSARLVNSGERHQLLVDARLPLWLGDSLRVAADLHGPGADPGRWQGRLYLKTRQFQLSGLKPALVASGMVVRGAADLELWVGVADGHIDWGSGSLDWLKPVAQRTGPDARQVSADRLSGRFHWRLEDGSWHIGVRGFQLQRGQPPAWPASDVDLVVQTGAELHLRGKASVVVLGELEDILPLLPRADDGVVAVLHRLRPGGQLHDAEFELRYRTGETPRVALRAVIDNLSLNPDGRLPGFSGVSGRIEGNLNRGTLHLDSTQARLIAPRLFPQPLVLTRLYGDVHWQRFADRLRVGAEQLRGASGPLAVQSRWQIDWPQETGAAPWLDLQLAADPVPLTAVSNYLPTRVMHAHAVDWFRHAFADGTASNLRALVQGRLDQLPYDGKQGRIEARFDFAGATLNFEHGWGPLEDLDGRAVFSGRSMRIEADAARIQDTSVRRAVATIRDLEVPWLHVDGTVDGALGGMLAYLGASPLHEHFAALVDNIDTTGDARLQLGLRIPLKHELGKVKVSGEVNLNGNDLLPRRGDIGLEDIHGTLAFTRYGVTVDKARAKVLGQPVTVSAHTEGVGPGAMTVVGIQGALKLVDFARRKGVALADYIDGATAWQALLMIRHEAPPDTPKVAMELHSDLKGIGVSLPPPFAKQPAETRPLVVGWIPGEETGHPLWFTYGNNVAARVLLDASHHIRKAAIHAGDTTLPELPAHDELHVSGTVSQVDLSQWLPVLSALDVHGEGHGLPASLDLTANEFRFGGARVEDISVRSKDSDPWHFLIDGKGAKGWVRWLPPGRARPAQLLVKLDHLTVAGSDEQGGKPDTDTLPAEMPELNVQIGDLRWGKRNLGQVNVASERTAEGTHFTTIKLDSPSLVLDGSGDWLVHEGAQVTRFSGRISGGTLEKLSEWLGSGGSVKGGKLTGTLQLSWPGPPTAFDLAKMEGEFDLQAKDGRLENVSEGGAGKLLSLFSLNSLQRRLTLDFRDVVKEGLTFDLMKGKFVVMDGDAFTENFTIKGTSATIDISGRTGLVARDYDQLVTVTPQVTATLPIAGAIAGGPAVGAAVYLADKLVGERFNRLTQVKYHVTGTWEKPVYTKLKKERSEKTRPPSGRDE